MTLRQLDKVRIFLNRSASVDEYDSKGRPIYVIYNTNGKKVNMTPKDRDENYETRGGGFFDQWINSMTEEERHKLWQLTEEDECREMEEQEKLGEI